MEYSTAVKKSGWLYEVIQNTLEVLLTTIILNNVDFKNEKKEGISQRVECVT